MNEALSAGREDAAGPYLPANHARAMHHLPMDSIDRSLDIHFRLVRHDNLQPLFKNVQGLLKERKEGMSPSGGRCNKSGFAGTTGPQDALSWDILVPHLPDGHLDDFMLFTTMQQVTFVAA